MQNFLQDRIKFQGLFTVFFEKYGISDFDKFEKPRELFDIDYFYKFLRIDVFVS